LRKKIFPVIPDRKSSDVDYHEKEEWVATAFKTITSQIQKYIIAKFLINLAADSPDLLYLQYSE
jgi:hypothetical protein